MNDVLRALSHVRYFDRFRQLFQGMNCVYCSHCCITFLFHALADLRTPSCVFPFGHRVDCVENHPNAVRPANATQSKAMGREQYHALRNPVAIVLSHVVPNTTDYCPRPREPPPTNYCRLFCFELSLYGVLKYWEGMEGGGGLVYKIVAS